MDTPSFQFRLERVRTLRAEAEDRAQRRLADELSLRVRGEALLREAAERAACARDGARSAATRGTTGGELLALHAWADRVRHQERQAGLELDRRDAEVQARRAALASASRERQSIDKLAERRRREHEREGARRAQRDLDEMALSVHRRGNLTP